MTRCLPKHSLNKRVYFSSAHIQDVCLSTRTDSIPKASLFKTDARAPRREGKERGTWARPLRTFCKFHMPFLLAFLC